jgi:CBS domain-containing protein
MLHLRDIMSRDVQTFSRDTTIGDALKTLSTGRMSGAPVLSEGKVCGIISVADIVGVIVGSSDDSGIQQKTVGEVMTGDIHSLPSSASIRNAATLMREKRIHRVLVIDDDALVGMVSALDVARAVSDRGVGNIQVIRADDDDPSPWITS